MKKNMKKIVSLLLAVVMVMAMMIPTNVFAEDSNYVITIKQASNDNATHTYSAYQIFAGDLSVDVLSNITWGTGVDTTKTVDSKTLIEAIQALDGFSNVTSASDVAEALTNDNVESFSVVVAKYLSSTSTESSEKVGDNSITVTDAGYYLIKDKSKPTGTDGASTSFILKVVASVEVDVKSDVPTVEKKVDDKNDSTTDEDAVDWKDSADYDIGDDVPFQLTGTLPTNYADYDYYSYEFHDTLSTGLTYNSDAKVYVVNGATETEITSCVDLSGAISSVKINDLKSVAASANVTIDKNSKIVVRYTAKLNNNAVIGNAGNSNAVYLEYSNNPNASGAGDNETGTTPTDTVIVFTYKVIVDKIDGEYNPLSGAAFTLYKKYSDSLEATGTLIDTEKYPNYTNYYSVATTTAGTSTSFEFTGIDDGSYLLVETTTPDGYNTVAPIEFTVTATHTEEEDTDGIKLTELSAGNSFVTAVENGTIATTKNTEDQDKTLYSGEIYTEVINNSGATLPSTGGMGTTLIYVIGTVLVLGAAILLVTKKRMNAEK